MSTTSCLLRESNLARYDPMANAPAIIILILDLFLTQQFLNVLIAVATEVAQLADRALLDETVRHTEARHAWGKTVVAHPLQYGRPHTARTDTVLDGDNTIKTTAHLLQDALVKRMS